MFKESQGSYLLYFSVNASELSTMLQQIRKDCNCAFEFFLSVYVNIQSNGPYHYVHFAYSRALLTLDNKHMCKFLQNPG